MTKHYVKFKVVVEVERTFPANDVGHALDLATTFLEGVEYDPVAAGLIKMGKGTDRAWSTLDEVTISGVQE